MKQETKDQFRIISWKNLIVMKRNPGELAMDILYPILFLLIILFISSDVKNEEVSETLVYNNTPAIPIAYTGFFKDGSNVVFMPASNSSSPLYQLANAFNQALQATNTSVSIHFFSTEDELNKWTANNEVLIAFEFEDPEALIDPAKEVRYFVRPGVDTFSITNWDPFVDTYKQEPSMTPLSFITVFTPLQQFMDSIVHMMKAGSAPSLSYTYVQFPNLSYSLDTRLSALSGVFPIYIILVIAFPMVTISRRLLEERSMRVQEAMLMTGLNEMVWYTSWYLTILIRSLVVCLAVAIVCVLVCVQTSFLVHLIIFVMSPYSYPNNHSISLACSSYSMALTSLFDKSETGSSVILLIMIFGGLPAMFLTKLNTWLYVLFSFVLPPMSMVEVSTLLLYSDSVYYSGYTLSNLFDPSATSLNVNLGIILISLILSAVGYVFFGFYLNKIVKHRYGKREECCYCIKNNKIIPIDSNEEDPAVLESIEPVSEEIASRDGIHIHHITKSFPPSKKNDPPIVAVKDFSASFYEGQITVLLGHNGAGKSTLISVLTGLYNTTSGDATLYQHSLNNELSLIRKDLGVCTQQNLMISVLTCREHLTLFARLRKVKEEEIPQMVEEALKDIDMLDKADAQAKTLSGGMKRRLNVAMALIGDPRIVFLDEPTSGMDPTSRRQIWSMLEKKKAGRVIVLCTHFMDEADFLGDRIVVMSKGTLQVAGSSLFLKSKYGLGYHVNVAKNQDAQDDSITAVIQKYIPQAVVEDVSHLSIQYMVPRDSTPVFAAMLKELDEKKTELRISDTGVSATTLEEVFVNLAAEAELEAQKEATTELQKDTQKESKKDSPTPVDAVTDSSSPSVSYKEFPVVENLGNHSSQFRILLWKKWLMAIRQKKELVQEVVLPLYCIVIGVLMLFIGSFVLGIEQNQAVSFGPEVLTDPVPNATISYFYQNEQEKSVLENLIQFIPKGENMTIPLFVDGSTYLKDYTDLSKSTYLLEKGYQIAALDLVSLYPIPNIRIWYNTSYSGVIPAMTNILDSAHLNSKLMTTGMAVSSSYKMLPESVTTPAVLTVIFVLCFCLYVSEGLNMLPSYAGVSVARERISQARLQQRLMGVNDLLYWLSTLLFDFLLVIPSLIVFLIAVIFFADGLRPAALPMTLVIFAFIWCTLPLCYLLSFPYQSASSAEQGIMNTMMICWMISLLISSLVGVVPWLTKYQDIIGYILYLVPSYAFFDSFRIVGSIFPQYAMLDLNPPSAWSMEYCGKALVYLVVEGIIFFAWTLIQERRNWVKNAKVTFEKEDYLPEDEDVKKEIERVDNYEKNRNPDEPYTEAISIKHIWKVYPATKKTAAVEACRDVTFGVTRGDCFGLLGPNGAGKTSLLSMLMGTLGYNSGSCKVFDESIPQDINIAYELLGYCPQFDVLFDFMTTYECLYFYGCVKGIPKTQIDQVIDQILHCLGLYEHRDKYTHDLSGGNKRRLCVAIAFMGNPQVVIMDEPSTGLDPVSRRKLWNIIKTSSTSRSFLLTTHLMEEADALCNRIAIMVNGQIKCIGSSQHLKSKFGEGFNLDFKVEDTPGLMEQFQNHLRSEVGEFEVRECYGNHAILVLPNTKPLSFLFELVEKAKETYKIVDYTLSQTTLDQVFLQFAKGQREETLTLTQEELLKGSS